MRECVDAVDAPGKTLGRLFRDSLGGVVDAANGVEHPQLVAGTARFRSHADSR